MNIHTPNPMNQQLLVASLEDGLRKKLNITLLALEAANSGSEQQLKSHFNVRVFVIFRVKRQSQKEKGPVTHPGLNNYNS